LAQISHHKHSHYWLLRWYHPISTATATATLPSRSSEPFCIEQSRKTHPFKRKSLWDNDTSKPQLNSNPEEFLNKEENVI